jgi:hypothetical protein
LIIICMRHMSWCLSYSSYVHESVRCLISGHSVMGFSIPAWAFVYVCLYTFFLLLSVYRAVVTMCSIL